MTDAPEDPVITGGDSVLRADWSEGLTATVFENFDATDPQGDTEGNGLTWSISVGRQQDVWANYNRAALHPD